MKSIMARAHRHAHKACRKWAPQWTEDVAQEVTILAWMTPHPISFRLAALSALQKIIGDWRWRLPDTLQLQFDEKLYPGKSDRFLVEKLDFARGWVKLTDRQKRAVTRRMLEGIRAAGRPQSDQDAIYRAKKIFRDA